MSERGPIISAEENRQMDFTAHQLTVFCTVAQRLSYTRAAEALYLSQPAVAQQIKTIEQVLGLRLFARKGRGIELTAAGQEFLRHAEHILALLAETAPVVREIQSLERGSVVVGASNSAGTYVVPSLLGAFHARFPRVRISLTVANRRAIEERLLAYQIDLAVMSLIEQPDHLMVELLMPYELVVVAAPSLQLARRSNLTVHDLEQEIILLREQGSGTRLNTEQYFAQAGLSLPSGLEFGSIEAIKEGVAAELGIAVLPREAVVFELANKDLVLLDVQGFPLKREWHVVHLQGRRLSRAASALREFLLQSP